MNYQINITINTNNKKDYYTQWDYIYYWTIKMKIAEEILKINKETIYDKKHD